MSPLEIPPLDLNRQYEPLYPDLIQAFSSFLQSGKFILGPDLVEFEKEVATYLGVKHAIAVSNGTDAILLSLRAAGVKTGDKVLTTPFTFFATVSAILAVGAEPVFADIDEKSFCLDPVKAEEALLLDKERKIKALIVVHLYGQPVQMDAFEKLSVKFGVPLIEDAAQAIGAKFQARSVGGLGLAGAFSFYPTKNLGALGDAGLVTTNQSETFERVKMLRAHGSKQQYHHDYVGGNFRMDTLQALFLRKFLPHLENWIATRQSIANSYTEYLKGHEEKLVCPTPMQDTTHVFHQYTVRIRNGKRDSFRSFLKENGISSTVYYPIPCHQQKALEGKILKGQSFEKSERAAKEVLSLPIFPTMLKEEREKVAETTLNWIKKHA